VPIEHHQQPPANINRSFHESSCTSDDRVMTLASRIPPTSPVPHPSRCHSERSAAESKNLRLEIVARWLGSQRIQLSSLPTC
jgi:hypothetical protein